MISLEKIQKLPGRNYFVKVLIQDTAGLWVDFSDRVKRYKDRAIGLPRIKVNTDSRALSHRFYASSGEMTVDNSDGFWDKPLDFTLKTEIGVTATFSNSKYGSETVWSGRKIQFRLVEFFNEIYREKALGTFLIDDVETDLSANAKLSIVDLSEPLRARDASVVKNGMSWYQNRSVSFLVNKLLELEFGTETNGMLPPGFDIDARIDLETYDGTSTLSTIGPPPQLTDTDGDGIANLYLEKQMRTRAMVIAPATIALANVADDNDTLYLACDEQLYSYNPTTDLYTQLTDTSDLGTGYYIRYLSYDSTHGAIYGYAYIDRISTFLLYLNDFDKKTPMNNTVKFFKYTSSGGIDILHTEDCYTGDFISRKSVLTDADTHVIGWLQSNTCGANIFTPYRQYMNPITYLAAGEDTVEIKNLEQADDFIGSSDTDLYNCPAYANNFLAFQRPIGSIAIQSTYSINYLVGSAGNICYNKNTGAWSPDGAFLHFGVNTNDILEWRILDVADELDRKTDATGNYITIDGVNCIAQPLCSCAHPSSFIFYTGVVAFEENDTALYNDWDGQIWTINYNTGAQAVLISTTAPWIPIDLVYNSYESTNKLYVVYLCQERSLNDGTNRPFFKVSKVNPSTGASEDISALANLSNQPKGMTFDSDGNMYFVSQQAGTLYKYSTTNGTLELLDSGFPIVEDSPFISAGLVLDTATRSGTNILWGVSAGDIDNQAMENTTQSGKCYLFKYDKVISETVELADFSDLSVWDALGYLAQRANCSMGFDEEGNFFFKRRAIDSTASYTINADKEDIFSITKDRGKDEIFNFVDITPYLSRFKDPEYKATLQVRKDSESDNTVGDDEITIKQSDLVTKKIDMICISDGDANVGADADSGYPIFKYTIYEPVITGRFVADQSSATVLSVGSTFGGADTDFGIKVGYYLLYTDTNEDEFYRRITAVDSATNSITIDAAISVKKNDEFSIYRRQRVSSADTSTKTWSDEGVTYVETGTTSTTQTLNSVVNLSAGNLIFLGNRFIRISSVDEDANTITLSTAITTTTGDIVKAYFAPAVHNVWYEIGNTNVQLMVASANTKTIFKQGDRITIDCPGLVLESDEASKQIALNTDSITKYGKKQYPNINNRFLTRKLAKQLAQKIRTLYSFGKYGFKVTMPLSSYLDVVGTANLARIDLRSQKLLPYSDGFTVPTRICSIDHDTKNGVTALELKADGFF